MRESERGKIFLETSTTKVKKPERESFPFLLPVQITAQKSKQTHCQVYTVQVYLYDRLSSLYSARFLNFPRVRMFKI